MFKRDKKSRHDIAKVAKKNVDPFGVQRVIMRLFPDLLGTRLRPAGISDSEKLYSWVNDSLVRINSFNNNFVSLEEHQKWFQNRLDTPNSKIFILEVDDLSLGQVRFDLTDEIWHIDYSLDSKFRGLGLGQRIIEMGLKEMAAYDFKKYVAYVREKNKTSQKIFESVGFTRDVISENQVIKYFFQFEKE